MCSILRIDLILYPLILFPKPTCAFLRTYSGFNPHRSCYFQAYGYGFSVDPFGSELQFLTQEWDFGSFGMMELKLIGEITNGNLKMKLILHNYKDEPMSDSYLYMLNYT